MSVTFDFKEVGLDFLIPLQHDEWVRLDVFWKSWIGSTEYVQVKSNENSAAFIFDESEFRFDVTTEEMDSYVYISANIKFKISKRHVNVGFFWRHATAGNYDIKEEIMDENDHSFGYFFASFCIFSAGSRRLVTNALNETFGPKPGSILDQNSDFLDHIQSSLCSSRSGANSRNTQRLPSLESPSTCFGTLSRISKPSTLETAVGLELPKTPRMNMFNVPYILNIEGVTGTRLVIQGSVGIEQNDNFYGGDQPPTDCWQQSQPATAVVIASLTVVDKLATFPVTHTSIFSSAPGSLTELPLKLKLVIDARFGDCSHICFVHKHRTVFRQMVIERTLPESDDEMFCRSFQKYAFEVTGVRHGSELDILLVSAKMQREFFKHADRTAYSAAEVRTLTAQVFANIDAIEDTAAATSVFPRSSSGQQLSITKGKRNTRSTKLPASIVVKSVPLFKQSSWDQRQLASFVRFHRFCAFFIWHEYGKNCSEEFIRRSQQQACPTCLKELMKQKGGSADRSQPALNSDQDHDREGKVEDVDREPSLDLIAKPLFCLKENCARKHMYNFRSPLYLQGLMKDLVGERAGEIFEEPRRAFDEARWRQRDRQQKLRKAKWQDAVMQRHYEQPWVEKLVCPHCEKPKSFTATEMHRQEACRQRRVALMLGEPLGVDEKTFAERNRVNREVCPRCRVEYRPPVVWDAERWMHKLNQDEFRRKKHLLEIRQHIEEASLQRTRPVSRSSGKKFTGSFFLNSKLSSEFRFTDFRAKKPKKTMWDKLLRLSDEQDSDDEETFLAQYSAESPSAGVARNYSRIEMDQDSKCKSIVVEASSWDVDKSDSTYTFSVDAEGYGLSHASRSGSGGGPLVTGGSLLPLMPAMQSMPFNDSRTVWLHMPREPASISGTRIGTVDGAGTEVETGVEIAAVNRAGGGPGSDPTAGKQMGSEAKASTAQGMRQKRVATMTLQATVRLDSMQGTMGEFSIGIDRPLLPGGSDIIDLESTADKSDNVAAAQESSRPKPPAADLFKTAKGKIGSYGILSLGDAGKAIHESIYDTAPTPVRHVFGSTPHSWGLRTEKRRVEQKGDHFPSMRMTQRLEALKEAKTQYEFAFVLYSGGGREAEVAQVRPRDIIQLVLKPNAGKFSISIFRHRITRVSKECDAGVAAEGGASVTATAATSKATEKALEKATGRQSKDAYGTYVNTAKIVSDAEMKKSLRKAKATGGTGHTRVTPAAVVAAAAAEAQTQEISIESEKEKGAKEKAGSDEVVAGLATLTGAKGTSKAEVAQGHGHGLHHSLHAGAAADESGPRELLPVATPALLEEAYYTVEHYVFDIPAGSMHEFQLGCSVDAGRSVTLLPSQAIDSTRVCDDGLSDDAADAAAAAQIAVAEHQRPGIPVETVRRIKYFNSSVASQGEEKRLKMPTQPATLRERVHRVEISKNSSDEPMVSKMAATAAAADLSSSIIKEGGMIAVGNLELPQVDLHIPSNAFATTVAYRGRSRAKKDKSDEQQRKQKFEYPALIENEDSDAMWMIGMPGLIPGDAVAVGMVPAKSELARSHHYSAETSTGALGGVDVFAVRFRRSSAVAVAATLDPLGSDISTSYSNGNGDWCIGYCLSGALENAEAIVFDNNSDGNRCKDSGSDEMDKTNSHGVEAIACLDGWSLTASDEAHSSRIQYLVDSQAAPLYAWRKGAACEARLGKADPFEFLVPSCAIVVIAADLRSSFLSRGAAKATSANADHVHYLVRGIVDGSIFPGLVRVQKPEKSAPVIVDITHSAYFAYCGTIRKLDIQAVEFLCDTTLVS